MTSERGAQYKRESLSRLCSHIYQIIPYTMRRRQRAEATTTNTQKPLTYRSEPLFPFLDISSGNFRISFYIITGAGWNVLYVNIRKLRMRNFLNEIFSSFARLAQKRQCWDIMRFLSHSRTKERFLNEIYVIFHLLLHWCYIALRSPCYPDIRYFPLLTFWHFKIIPFEVALERRTSKNPVELLCMFALLLLGNLYRGRMERRSQNSLRAMLENFSERKTFTLRRWC